MTKPMSDFFKRWFWVDLLENITGRTHGGKRFATCACGRTWLRYRLWGAITGGRVGGGC